MVIILVYYNPNRNCFYTKFVKSCLYYEVGYINQYDHILVQILVYDDKLISIKNHIDYYKKSKKIKEESKKNRLINRTIDLLNKLKE